MLKLKFFLFFFLFSSPAFSKCISFTYGVPSVDRNEISSVNCKLKQVFYNSDIFLNKKTKGKFFIGEYSVDRKNLKRVSSLVYKIKKKSKISSLDKIRAKHGMYLACNNKFYELSNYHFKSLNSAIAKLNRTGKPKSGIFISAKKPYLIKDYKKTKNLKIQNLKSAPKFFYYAGLFWNKD